MDKVKSGEPKKAVTLRRGMSRHRLALFALAGLSVLTQASATTWEIPLSFEANQGQMDDRIDFIFRHGGYDLVLHPGGATAYLEPLGPGQKPAALRWEMVDMDPTLRGAGEEALGAVSHYINSPKPSQWKTNVPHFRKVRYASAYPGIDLVYYESKRMLEYDFVVAPGVDPDVIAVRLHGARQVDILADGSLAISTPAGTVTQPPPVAYQGSKDRSVPVAYRVAGSTVTFDLGHYDPSLALTIDPPLAYSTFLGGTQADYANDLVVDDDGFAFVTGFTGSGDFPSTSGVFEDTFNGFGQAAFVAKIDPNGENLIWSTFIAPASGARGQGIAVNAQGQPAIVGAAGPQSDLWTSDNAVQDSVGNGEHVFVALLADDGSDLLYSTFFSGFNGSGPGGIAVGQDGDLFITGRADTASLPIANGYQDTLQGITEAFIARLDPDSAPGLGSSLRYSSYLGGSNSDVGDSIAAASDGSAVITGRTQSTNINTTVFPQKNAQQGSPGGRTDAFVAKFDTNAADEDSLVFSTFLGGNQDENPGPGQGGIVLDELGNIYVGGTTYSADFVTTPGAFKETGNTFADAFVAKYDGTGQVIWSTLLGGSFVDTLTDLALDRQGWVGVTGTTDSSDLPLVDPFQPERTNSTDAYLAVLSPDGSALAFSSFLGGSSSIAEQPAAVAFDASGNLYAAGTASGGGFSPFPTTAGSYQPESAGGFDAYILKVDVQWAEYVDPTFADLERLRENSDTAVTVDFGGAFPRALKFDVPAVSSDPIVAARGFLESYPALFQQVLPRSGDNPSAVALSQLHVASLYQEDDAEMVVFYQTLGDLPVFGSRLSVMVDSSNALPMVRMVIGALLPPLPLDTTPALTADEALAAARVFLSRPGVPAVNARLMVFDQTSGRGSRDPRLVWSVMIWEGGPHQVLVDAHSGEVVLDQSLEHELIDGLPQINLWDGFSFLQWSTLWNGSGCSTSLLGNAGDESGLAFGYTNDPEAFRQVQHYQDTLDFYFDAFGRRSFDNSGSVVQTMIYSATSNASFMPGCGFQSRQGWVGFDIAVHEFTHAVIYDTSRLQYFLFSGALNESYSDIMGAVVDNQDWLIGEDRTGNNGGGGAIRSLADPLNAICAGGEACAHPDKLSLVCLSDDDCNFSGDNGAVHTNSGIPNKAHYLMAAGGTFNGVNVGSGMGRTKMARVAYGVMRYLSPVATFEDARSSSLLWAAHYADKNLHGFTPADVCTVRNAWAAVEIGDSDEDCDGIIDANDDSDNDGVFDDTDNCPAVPNPLQFDLDGDGIGDLCDPETDSDGDSCPDMVDTCPGFFSPCPTGSLADSDGDGIGNLCDPDVDGDGIANGPDNCNWDPNPDQLDGNMDGQGDACDPDFDGDGLYADEDNCPFVENLDQMDTDDDGLGDACDTCPETPDNPNAYTLAFPRSGLVPQPAKPDSDKDGIPDACDEVAFDNVSLAFGGSTYNPSIHRLSPDGEPQVATIVVGTSEDNGGDNDNIIQIAVDACSGSDTDVLADGQRVQLFAEDLPPEVEVYITDDLGARVATMNRSSQPGLRAGTLGRGLWFKPNCARPYTLNIRLPESTDPQPKGQSTLQFMLTSEVAPDGDLPWTDPDQGFDPAPPIPDVDSDSQPDDVDNCPFDPNADQLDSDLDGIGDVCDACNGAEPVPGLGDGADCGELFVDGFER